MPEFQRPTVTLHYEDAGSSDAHAPVLVFLHGWCDAGSSWADTAADFATEYRCIVPDMRGHGRSGLPRDYCYSPEALSNDVVALCQSLGVEHPVLVGHSFGGYLAAEIARRFPQFARAIVVEDQPLDLRGFGEQMRALESVIRSPESHMAFRNGFYESMVTEKMPPAGVELTRQSAAATPMEVGMALWAPLFEFTAEEMAERSDLLMKALTHQPSLSIEHAEAPDYHAALAEHAPYAGTRVIECGHWIHLERPAEFRAELRDFLSVV
jgi:pimeloyl-ACP methyl ester carboxylesterase